MYFYFLKGGSKKMNKMIEEFLLIICPGMLLAVIVAIIVYTGFLFHTVIIIGLVALGVYAIQRKNLVKNEENFDILKKKE